MLRIGFDVGGVLSKYPDVFRRLLDVLGKSGDVEVYIISDMHPVQKVIDMLALNGIIFSDPGRVRSADYRQHGGLCKAILCQELGIDLFIDDHMLPYYADTWKTDGSEGDFGRRNPPESKHPQGKFPPKQEG